MKAFGILLLVAASLTGTSAQADEETYGAHAATSSAAATIAIMLAGIAAFLNLYATQPLLPLFARDFDASPAEVSLTIGATTLAVALGAPFVGVVADVVGRKRIIAVAMVLMVIPTALIALSSSIGQMVVS